MYKPVVKIWKAVLDYLDEKLCRMKKNKYVVKNFALRIGKSPTGKGLFTTCFIPKNTCIIEYIGKAVKQENVEKNNSKYLFEVGKNKTINGNVKYNTARYINHSCKPNCEADGPDGHVYISSIKNIKAGEELTYDYGEEYFDEYIKPKGCRCPKCQKTLAHS